MKKSIILTCALLLVSAVQAGPPEAELVKKLTDAITNLCPDAVIEVDGHRFSAKHHTMVYTIHRRSKTGEVYPETYEQEGPGFRGFILTVVLRDGDYEGAAAVPQTLSGPYYPTFIDAPSTDDGKRHYQVHFSYGPRLDPELIKAIFEAVPKTDFQPVESGNGEAPPRRPTSDAQ